jgi:diaminopimelate epimerase
MDVPFLKMNGLGNDFVVIDARKHAIAMTEEAARAIGDRHRGVGYDQLLVIGGPKKGAEAEMRIWNPDGSEVESCGNGTRCVASLIMAETGKDRMTLWTKGGLLECTRADDERVTVDMGEPKLEWQDIPLAERMDTRTIDVKVGPIDAPVLFNPSAVNMGNPHCVFFVENADAHDLQKIGPMLEYHPMFPERANITVAQVRSKAEIRARVWERGAGQTLACGTAACATAVSAVRRRMADRKVRVVLDGGPLDIEWRESDNHVLMTGPAELSFSGVLPARYFEARA